ncbi:MAG: polyribonucleotide nucleotidyltransferase [Bacteriovoracaceae bacterium]
MSFTLTVEYVEKFYSAGKLLGGFIKREARPSTSEILTARLIDRPLRPLFPEGYMYETVVSAMVVSFEQDGGDQEVLASIGAAAALAVSDIPFNGPLAACRVVKTAEGFTLNATEKQKESAEIELIVAASKDAILMVEGEAKEVQEADMVAALKYAHENIKVMCELIETMRKESGKKTREYTAVLPNKPMMKKLEAEFTSAARECLNVNDKLARQAAVAKFEAKVAEAFAANFADYNLKEKDNFKKEAHKGVDLLLYNIMRNDILSQNKRIGGRGLEDIRKIECEVDVLRKTHGSSLFTRGETQVMATVTLGGKEGDQLIDRIVGLKYDKFYLHYAFPAFSVGEARASRGVGRRELGHGNLAQRAIAQVLPDKESFDYTVRVTCEVLESNGSSSMASVCSASMALMDAGINTKAPVAGIAMGLIKEGDNYKILSDILGDEDHLGDMDFKVAGTEKGICSIQIDIKINGITFDIFSKALDQAKRGRFKILGEMAKTISSHRKEMKQGVPRVVVTKIPSDKIGAIIGPGGSNIKGLQEMYKATIEILEDGTVRIQGPDAVKLNGCLDHIQLQITGPKEGHDYTGTVVTIKDYGAFVDILPGVSGLLHVSEISNERVDNVEDYLTLGETIKVRVVELDRFGRVKFSAKAIAPIAKKAKK